MRQVNKNFKNESIIRTILAIIGILSFAFSTQFGWGFIISGIVSKESIDLKTKEGLTLLFVTSGVMIFVLYYLLTLPAVLGYIASTISYFILRELFNRYKNK